jgi:predicted ABC-type ATPase
MPSLYLIRGVSGAGKSTFAYDLSSLLDCNYWEADMYFYDTDSREYKFNPAQIGQAHGWCFQRFYTDVCCNLNVIVSNTFTTEMDMQRYIDTAKEFGYNVVSLVVENRHGGKSVHDVPEATLQRQEALLRKNLKFR